MAPTRWASIGPGRQSTAHPQIQAWSVLMADADEVTSLISCATSRRPEMAVLYLRRGVGEVGLADVATHDFPDAQVGSSTRRATCRPTASPALPAGSHRTPRWSAVRHRLNRRRFQDVFHFDPVVVARPVGDAIGGGPHANSVEIWASCAQRGIESAAVATHPQFYILARA